MIQDGKSGFLIEHDDNFEDNFANEIIEVLANDKLNESLIDYAATSMDAYTHSAVAQRWQKLIKSF
jgi:glycosyltransferase involved in cell wall biosynthesis